MATIPTSTSEKIISIKQFLGLHESADGDNKLKVGEATVCDNFKITNSGSLKKRPGTKLIADIAGAVDNKPIRGLWNGYVNGKRVFLASCNGKLYSLYNDSTGAFYTSPVEIGSLSTTYDTGFIPFENKLYIFTGVNYYQLSYVNNAWSLVNISDGTHGYRPLVAITVPPSGGGELLEQVNKLNGLRRCWISPNGTDATFQLPESGLTSVDYVKINATGSIVPTTDYTVNLTNGTVTFNEAPVLGVDSYEIGWTVPTNYASTVGKMRYAELYSGTTDTLMFAYGDGSNECIYTGLDYDGNPRGDYYPDLNEVAVGDENTPITGIIRHYAKLIVYKTDSSYSIEYGVTTLANSNLTQAFYVTPLNRIIGNEALGQVELVLSGPRTLCQSNLYEWRNTSSYTSNLSMDERQAKRISDRIYDTLSKYDFKNCHCYDDNHNSEYYIIYDGDCLVHNYVADAWYKYNDLDMYVVIEFDGDLYIGTTDGKVTHMSENFTADQDLAITCRWESGAMDFGAMHMKKYSALMWLGIKPELNNEIMVTAETDRSTENAIATVEPDFSSDMPTAKRVKIKVKKFTNYKLIFRSQNLYSRCTLVDAEIRVRYTSYAK